jgi:hypothetical protein
MKYIVVIIHNQSLGRVVEVFSEGEGKDLIIEWFKEQFQRDLNDGERQSLDDCYEIINMDDHDNHYTFSIGIIDN